MASYWDSSDDSSSPIIVVQLQNLPLELLVQILSYLGNRKDLVTCFTVSKIFYAAANSPLLWKALCQKVWRIHQCKDDDWKECYAKMFVNWSRYEQCYADIRTAWDRIETYVEKFCPSLLRGLRPGATEEELNRAESQNLNGRSFPDDYRCFLRIHNGQRNCEEPGVMGSTCIADHHKRESLLSAQISSGGINHRRTGLQGCIPITLCVTTTTGHYMAISEEAGHKRGRIFWPSVDNETVNLSGGGRLNCFVMADSFTQWINSYSENMIKEQYPVIENEIYPYKLSSSVTSSNGITVATATCFLPELSNINPPHFFFTYRISISMDPSVSKRESCQLETRHWYITDGNGRKKEVHGAAVVGYNPTMSPGANFEYVSCTSFRTPTGTMEGHYVFRFLHKEGTTNARIAPMNFESPPFELATDRIQRRSSEMYCSESESD